MCGRFALSVAEDELVGYFQIDQIVTDHTTHEHQTPDTQAPTPHPAAAGGPSNAAQPEAIDDHHSAESEPPCWLQPRYNIAPTHRIAAIVERAQNTDQSQSHTGQRESPADQQEPVIVRKLVGLRWGLIPSWSKGPDSRFTMINARRETVDTKPAYRAALARRRCIIPASGYYEWRSIESTGTSRGSRTTKQPYFIRPTGPSLMAMAGLYEFWKSPQGEWIASCTIMTTQASDELGMIHDRMPVQVLREAWDDWLDPSLTDSAAALSVLPNTDVYPMTAYPVSTLVNKVGNDDPQLMEPIDQ